MKSGGFGVGDFGGEGGKALGGGADLSHPRVSFRETEMQRVLAWKHCLQAWP